MRDPLVTIEHLEVSVSILLVAVAATLHSRKKNIAIKKHPEYRYYLWGLYAKVLGGVFFTLIYLYYYGNGDTVSFYLSAIPLVNVFMEDPMTYLKALFAENTMENRMAYFSPNTGYPLGYIYFDPRTYTLVRIISPLMIIGFKSFLLTTILVAMVSYTGVWRLYRMLVRYYPKLRGKLAIAVLFMPSCIFWGSGILKDTFTFAAMCWYIAALDSIFFLKKDRIPSWIAVILSVLVMVAMKPYIFMAIFPASILWLIYNRVARIRSSLVRLLAIPVGMALLVSISLFTLNSLGDKLDKFSLENALQTTVTTQRDMKRSEQYGSNYFDLGEIEPTWGSVMSKFPAATFAGLYRPSLLESNNVVMLLAALENTWLLLLSIQVLVRTRVWHLITLIRVNPLLQMCYLFAIGYAFMIGITTPNFGALVRFKIPLLPFMLSGLFITSHILDRRRDARGRKGRFSFQDFVNGDPDRPPDRPVHKVYA